MWLQIKKKENIFEKPYFNNHKFWWFTYFSNGCFNRKEQYACRYEYTQSVMFVKVTQSFLIKWYKNTI